MVDGVVNLGGNGDDLEGAVPSRVQAANLGNRRGPDSVESVVDHD